MAVDDFVAELRGLGHEDARVVGAGCVALTWAVPTGPLLGRRIELGCVVADDYPDTPPKGPFLRPHLLPLNSNGGVHPYASVHNGSQHGFPDDTWQYWSRPINGWARSRNAKAYLAHIRQLFDTLPDDL
jgi:hypothetical protein